MTSESERCGFVYLSINVTCDDTPEADIHRPPWWGERHPFQPSQSAREPADAESEKRNQGSERGIPIAPEPQPREGSQSASKRADIPLLAFAPGVR
jgi:hypothetical protein